MATPYYKKYIAALIHNPNVIQDVVIEKVNTKGDKIARKAIKLLQSSATGSNNSKDFVWNGGADPYPHIQQLYGLITDRQIEKETDDFEKKLILEYFPDEVKCLQEIYKNVEPDGKTLRKRPMIVDLFGFVHKVVETTTEIYFNEVGSFGANIKCPKCKVVTHFTGRNRNLFNAEPTDIVKYQYEHQCQHCGKLKMADVGDKEIFLEKRCECGGYFKRDKPLLCPECKPDGSKLLKWDYRQKDYV